MQKLYFKIKWFLFIYLYKFAIKDIGSTTGTFIKILKSLTLK